MNFVPLLRAGLLVSAVALLPATTAGLAAVDGRAGPQFGRLLAVYNLVKAQYVENVDDDKLVNGAIDGMLAALDPHSTYLEGATLTRLTTMIDGIARTKTRNAAQAEAPYWLIKLAIR